MFPQRKYNLFFVFCRINRCIFLISKGTQYVINLIYLAQDKKGIGIGLCLCLVYAYFTAGVLRRPNASIYMSVLLAVVYYLTQMRSEQPDALPDGEEKRA